ncbi:MAG: DUF4388 domain-containing protein [Myxococcota bacterium]
MRNDLNPAPLPQPGRIVVIDDSAPVLRVVERVLSQHGFQVWSADDGSRAVELVREAQPEIVLVDFAMPGVNGFDVCRMLGEHEDLESIPIVIMSTRGDPVGERFVREMGIVDHIRKPFAPEALVALIEHALVRARRPKPRWSIARAEGAPGALQALAEQLAEVAGVEAEPLVQSLSSAATEPTWIAKARHWLSSAEGAPAFSGDLSQCGLAEIFQMIGLQRQTGCLTVRSYGIEIEAWFGDGLVRMVTGVGIPEEHMLGTLLVRRGHLTTEELHEVLSTRHNARRRFGAHAVKLGYLDQGELEAAMRAQSSELVYEMLRFGGGTFDFHRRELLDTVLEFGFELTVDELLMEGFRRVDEWGLIETAIPSFDAVPERAQMGAAKLTDAERGILDLIDGTRTVREVLDAAGLGTFEGARMLYRLVSGRVVRLLTPSTANQNLVG